MLDGAGCDAPGPLAGGRADRYRFAHDVIREVVEADLGMARRMVLHRRIAEALEQQVGVGPVELLAYHYGRGGVQDKAARYLEQAGDRALAQYANAAAESFYVAAVEAWEQLRQPLETARAAGESGGNAASDGALRGRAGGTGAGGRGVQEGGNRAQWIKIVAEIGRHYEYRGKPAEGLRWLEPQVAALEAATAADIPGTPWRRSIRHWRFCIESLGR